MSITSMLFLFMFLPLTLSIYYMVNVKAKEYVLLVVSMLFYAVCSLKYFIIFLCATFLTVVIGRCINAFSSKILRRLLLVAGIFMNVGLLIYYKYADFIIVSFNQIFHSDLVMRNLLLPLGISFFTFKAISYLADIYKKQVVLDENPIHDALYLSFFAQIQSGPLVRYSEMRIEGETKALFSDGVYRFLIGFNKKILLSNVLANVTTEVFATPFENFSTAYAWLGAICYSLQLFFDFSGYSDMAIGISEMFGYRCRENFNYPYMTESVSRFWRRWHISLSEWFRDYIYIPLGGSKNKRKLRVLFNLLVVWLFTGIWHGAAWNFVFWGLGYFVLISFEHLTKIPSRFESKAGKIIYRIFTLLFIICQWVMFRADSVATGLNYIKRMFVFETTALANSRALFLLKEYFVFIVFAIILCFPIVPWISKKLENKGKKTVIFEFVLCGVILGLFCLSLSFVIAGQNNPFAYANF